MVQGTSTVVSGKAPGRGRRTLVTSLAAAPMLAVVIIGADADATGTVTVGGSVHAETTDSRATVTTRQFQAYQPGATAITYDQTLVPAGARISVGSVSVLDGTEVLLTAQGLVPGRDYGAHAHNTVCGQSPADAGPHYQHQVDPVQPSVDPVYANPDNEIWLDFTTDAAGNGTARATVDWAFGERHPNAVVLHEHHTRVMPGEAGTAGPRLACATVPF